MITLILYDERERENRNHFFMVLGSLEIPNLKICIHKELSHPSPIRLGGVFCPPCSFT